MNFNPEISHEFPLDIILNYPEFYHTDYDYWLIHHNHKDPHYHYKFLSDSQGKHRKSILDNSIFELGESFNTEDYFNFICKYSDYLHSIVLPDVFNDFHQNIASQLSFLNRIEEEGFNRKFKIIGVIQGQTFEELVSSYETLSNSSCDVIAIPFGSKAFEEFYVEDKSKYFPTPVLRPKYNNDLLYRKTINRVYFLNFIFNTLPQKECHLLGNFYPVEYLYYVNLSTDFSKIVSIDTSHPVALAYEDKNYLKDENLYYKPKVKIENIFYEKVGKDILDLIRFNIETFRAIVKGLIY